MQPSAVSDFREINREDDFDVASPSMVAVIACNPDPTSVKSLIVGALSRFF
jgi:hypothetical protein